MRQVLRTGALALLCALAGAAWSADGPMPPSAATREAYSQPLPGLSEEQQQAFLRGRSLFRQSWVPLPSDGERAGGLGPLYNRLACVSCHARNGRGKAPLTPDERMQSMLLRLSLPGHQRHGGPRPHPVYGDQLNEEGIPGVPGEGRAELHWEDSTVALADGEQVTLRRPRIHVTELGYGPLGPVLMSARVGQPVYGLGLLQAVPDARLHALAHQPQPDGIHGQTNRVWDVQAQRTRDGRFGWKANQPSLRQQIAGALHGDLGVTSSLYPQQNCSPRQTACRAVPHGPQPELGAAQLDDLHSYLSLLAPPTQRNPDDPQVRLGQTLFAASRCTACHRPQLETGASPFAPLARRRIAPYSDLLLHDMGPGLADARPDFRASGSQWRTPPLWGIGLSDEIGEDSGYLHDGRARTLQEAVLWHGGEARLARQRYTALPQSDREALLAFLRSL